MLTDRLQELPSESIFGNEGVGVDLKFEIPKHNSVVELGRRLLKAARQGNTTQVHDLMTKGAPFTTDWLGTSALHLAAMNNHLEACEVLLRAGISKDTRTKVERTPLHLASYEGHSKIVELLLKNKAEVDPLDMLRMTPLHWAVEKEHVPCIELLLQHGADPSAVSKFDKTPLSIALEVNRLDLAQLLQLAARLYPNREMLLHDEESMEQAEATLAATESLAYELQTEEIEQEDNDAMDETGEIDENTYDHRSIDFNETETETNEIQKEIVVEPDICQDNDLENNNMEDLVTATKLSDPKGNNSVNSSSHLSALQMLQAHGITMLPSDEGGLINNAIQSGRTVVLSEAGKLMLAESNIRKAHIKTEPNPIQRPKVVLHPSFRNKKIIHLTADQFLAMTNTVPQKPNILKKVSAEAFKKAAQNSGVHLSSLPPPLKVGTKNKITYINSKDRRRISISKEIESTSPKIDSTTSDSPTDRTDLQTAHNVQEKLEAALKEIIELKTQLEQKDKENRSLRNQIESLLKTKGETV